MANKNQLRFAVNEEVRLWVIVPLKGEKGKAL